MKIFIPLFAFVLMPMILPAQDSWKITLNNKVILSSTETNEKVNTKKVTFVEWKKKGFLEASFTPSNSEGWLYSLQFTDETGNQLLAKDSVYAKVATASIRKSAVGKKEIKIYIAISPANSLIMVPSRLLHLCTLKLP